MKVSVIVPVYNVEQYLEKCLDSIVGQTLKDIEVIVVNDGTKDHSQEIIDRYAEKYTNIISLKKDNGGLSDARNFGMKYARGEYISFVDSDDYIEPDMMEKMYEKAVRDNLDIVVCDTDIVHENYSYVFRSHLHFTEDNVRAYIFASTMACIRLVKREVMEKFSFQKGIFYEDLNLTPVYVTATRKIGFLEKPFYHYIQRPSSIMNQVQFNEKLLDIFTVLRNVKKEYVKSGIFEEFKDEIEYLYLIHLLRSATLRFLQYDNTEPYLRQINNEMKKEFPNWKRNPYLHKSNVKFKAVCYLAYHRCYGVLKVLNKYKG